MKAVIGVAYYLRTFNARVVNIVCDRQRRQKKRRATPGSKKACKKPPRGTPSHFSKTKRPIISISTLDSDTDDTHTNDPRPMPGPGSRHGSRGRLEGCFGDGSSTVTHGSLVSQSPCLPSEPQRKKTNFFPAAALCVAILTSLDGLLNTEVARPLLSLMAPFFRGPSMTPSIVTIRSHEFAPHTLRRQLSSQQHQQQHLARIHDPWTGPRPREKRQGRFAESRCSCVRKSGSACPGNDFKGWLVEFSILDR